MREMILSDVEKRKSELIPLMFRLSPYLKKSFIDSTTNIDYNLKANNEVISEFDLVLNNEILAMRNQFFKEDSFLSEESEYEKGTNDFTWVLDPIDGSSNFVYSVNLFCISLSIYHKKEPVLSFIVDPLTSIIYMSFFEENWLLKDTGETKLIQPIYKENEAKETHDYFLGGSVFANYKIHLIDPIKKEFYALLGNADYYRSMGCIAKEIVLGSLRRPFVFFTVKVRQFDVAAALHFARNMGYSYIVGKKSEFLLLYPQNLVSHPIFEPFLKAVKNHWETMSLNTLEI